MNHPATAATLLPLVRAAFDALLDHVHEYGTAEGVAQRAEALLRALADRAPAAKALIAALEGAQRSGWVFPQHVEAALAQARAGTLAPVAVRLPVAAGSQHSDADLMLRRVVYLHRRGRLTDDVIEDANRIATRNTTALDPLRSTSDDAPTRAENERADNHVLRASCEAHNAGCASACDALRAGPDPGSGGLCLAYMGRGRICPDFPRHAMIDLPAPHGATTQGMPQ